MKTKTKITLCILLFVSLGSAGSDEEVKIMTMTFKNISIYEYNVSLIFENEAGEDVLFSYFDISPFELEFYFDEAPDGAMFPEYHVNSEKVGKQFLVTCIEKEVESEFTGEMESVYAVMHIEPIESPEDEHIDDPE
jgi:hypothetical protein